MHIFSSLLPIHKFQLQIQIECAILLQICTPIVRIIFRAQLNEFAGVGVACGVPLCFARLRFVYSTQRVRHGGTEPARQRMRPAHQVPQARQSGFMG